MHHFLRSLLILVALPLFIFCLEDVPTQTNQDPVEYSGIQRGYQQFRDLDFKQHEQEFVQLVKNGQNPQILLVTCSDSRIVPDLILKTGPGDLFTIRTAGNFIPPYNSDSHDGVTATIQYAVEVVGIKHIIVCGHSHCGAIQSLFKHLGPNLKIVENWLELGQPAKEIALAITKKGIKQEQLYENAAKISILFQLKNLKEYPFVKNLLDKELLELHGWYYVIEKGLIEYFDTKKCEFLPLDQANTKEIIKRKIQPCLSNIQGL